METKLSQLLEKDPTSLYRWLRQVQTQGRSAPQELNWVELAQAATARASLERQPGGHQDLWWAHVTLAAYQMSIPATSQHDEIDVAMMHLRALFIRRYRSIPGNDLLDVDQIVSWFWARLPCTLLEAQHKVTQLETLRTRELFELRQIKNRLAVLIPLVRDHKLQPNEELQRWLESRDSLP